MLANPLSPPKEGNSRPIRFTRIIAGLILAFLAWFFAMGSLAQFNLHKHLQHDPNPDARAAGDNCLIWCGIYGVVSAAFVTSAVLVLRRRSRSLDADEAR